MDQATDVLNWMEQSWLGEWVATSSSGYYVMLAFHSLGLAALVGTMMVIDLRLLGFAKGISLGVLQRLSTIAWVGFCVNVTSGVALFFSEANKMYHATAFRWKISLVFIGVIAMAAMNRTVLKPLTTSMNGETASGAKVQAAISLAVWVAVIIVGRMIAYVTDMALY